MQRRTGSVTLGSDPWQDAMLPDRDRLLLFLQQHADTRGIVRFNQRQIGRKVFIVQHDVAKQLWGIQKLGLVTFSERKLGGKHGREKSELRNIRLTPKGMAAANTPVEEVTITVSPPVTTPETPTAPPETGESKKLTHIEAVYAFLQSQPVSDDGWIESSNAAISKALGLTQQQVNRVLYHLRHTGSVDTRATVSGDSSERRVVGYKLTGVPPQHVKTPYTPKPKPKPKTDEETAADEWRAALRYEESRAAEPEVPATPKPRPSLDEVIEGATYKPPVAPVTGDPVQNLISAAEYAASMPRGNISTAGKGRARYDARRVSLDALAEAVIKVKQAGAIAKVGPVSANSGFVPETYEAGKVPLGRALAVIIDEVLFDDYPTINQLLNRDSEFVTAAEALNRAGYADKAEEVLELAASASPLEQEVLSFIGALRK